MTDSPGAPITVDVWSDVACPWCAIGAKRLDAATALLAQRPDAPELQVRFHAFQLDPDAAHTERSHAEDLAHRKGMSVDQVQQMFAQITETAAQDGLTFDFDRVRSASTRKAHELIAFASEQGRQREAVDALHHAYFGEGADIEDLDTLTEIGASIGLDAAALREALETGRHEPSVDIDLDEARRLGVNGVPFFVFDAKYAFSGAQPAEMIVRVVDHVLTERAANEPAGSDAAASGGTTSATSAFGAAANGTAQ